MHELETPETIEKNAFARFADESKWAALGSDAWERKLLEGHCELRVRREAYYCKAFIAECSEGHITPAMRSTPEEAKRDAWKWLGSFLLRREVSDEIDCLEKDAEKLERDALGLFLDPSKWISQKRQLSHCVIDVEHEYQCLVRLAYSEVFPFLTHVRRDKPEDAKRDAWAYLRAHLLKRQVALADDPPR